MRVRELFMSLVMLASMLVLPVCSTNTSIDQDDDFSSNSVIVVMTKEAGGINKIHDNETFGDIAEQIVKIIDLCYLDNPETALANWENWLQILCLTLDREDKTNVLRVVEYLNQLDVVHYSEPNYYVYPC